MNNAVSVADLLTGYQHIGQTVSVPGWLKSRRTQGSVILLDLADHNGTISVVLRRNDINKAVAKSVLDTPLDSSVRVIGRFGTYRLQRQIELQTIEIVGPAKQESAP